MTASLIGFAKVPTFDVVFPEKPKPASFSDLEAFFAGFTGVEMVKR